MFINTPPPVFFFLLFFLFFFSFLSCDPAPPLSRRREERLSANFPIHLANKNHSLLSITKKVVEPLAFRSFFFSLLTMISTPCRFC